MAELGKPIDAGANEQLPTDVAAKLEAIRKAAAYCDAPTGDIENMLAEIELGYISQEISNE